jgi:hypothetical protein
MVALSLSSGGSLLLSDLTWSSTISDISAGINRVTRLESSLGSANSCSVELKDGIDDGVGLGIR